MYNCATAISWSAGFTFFSRCLRCIIAQLPAPGQLALLSLRGVSAVYNCANASSWSADFIFFSPCLQCIIAQMPALGQLVLLSSRGVGNVQQLAMFMYHPRVVTVRTCSSLPSTVGLRFTLHKLIKFCTPLKHERTPHGLCAIIVHVEIGEDPWRCLSSAASCIS